MLVSAALERRIQSTKPGVWKGAVSRLERTRSHKLPLAARGKKNIRYVLRPPWLPCRELESKAVMNNDFGRCTSQYVKKNSFVYVIFVE